MRRQLDSYSLFVRLAKLVILAVAVGMIAVLYLSSRNVVVTRQEAGPQSVSSDCKDEFEGAVITVVTDDDTRLFLKSKSACNAPDRVDLRGLEGEVTFATGETLELSSGRGIYYGEEEAVRFLGNVKFISSEGYSLRAGELDLNGNFRTIQGRRSVKVETQLGSLKGESVEVSGRDQRLMVYGSVKCESRDAGRSMEPCESAKLCESAEASGRTQGSKDFGVVFESRDAEYSLMACESVEVSGLDQRLRASGNVIFESREAGYSLKAGEIDLNGGQRTVSGRESVRVETRLGILTGESVVVSGRDQRFMASGGVMFESKDAGYSLKAGEIDLNGKAGRIIGKTGVHMDALFGVLGGEHVDIRMDLDSRADRAKGLSVKIEGNARMAYGPKEGE